MLQMMEINIMLLNNRKMVILFTSLLLSLLSINCLAQTSVVSCPATFSDRHTIYHLYHAKLFDGPVCKKVQLQPEFKNDKEIWVLDARMDPSLVCIYDGTNHYIVLDANGATYCEITKAPVQAKCMS
ncbi:STY0301 family protein [Snodgrassella communis]|uniref:STY0301 family protein n=1 Tax=Snodgrassella communis TaxID=2946699 RepID=UPI001EF4D5AE|nr:STY0301 family protein [Snodgrassella communis]